MVHSSAGREFHNAGTEKEKARYPNLGVQPRCGIVFCHREKERGPERVALEKVGLGLYKYYIVLLCIAINQQISQGERSPEQIKFSDVSTEDSKDSSINKNLTNVWNNIT